MRIEQVRHLLDVSIGDASSDFKDIASSIKILAGDFNSTRDEQPLKEIGYFFNPVEKQGTDYRTWPAVNPAIDIDHIFTFKGQKWDVKKIEIPHNSPAFTWSSASDHLPLSRIWNSPSSNLLAGMAGFPLSLLATAPIANSARCINHRFCPILESWQTLN